MHEVGACLLHKLLPHFFLHLTSRISSLLPLNAFLLFHHRVLESHKFRTNLHSLPFPPTSNCRLGPLHLSYASQPFGVADSALGSWTAPYLHPSSCIAFAVLPCLKPSERPQFPRGPSLNVSACPTRPLSTKSHILPFPDSPQARQGIYLVCFKEAVGFPPTHVNSEKLV